MLMLLQQQPQQHTTRTQVFRQHKKAARAVAHRRHFNIVVFCSYGMHVPFLNLSGRLGPSQPRWRVPA
jgi:hypothetical protein